MEMEFFPFPPLGENFHQVSSTGTRKARCVQSLYCTAPYSYRMVTPAAPTRTCKARCVQGLYCTAPYSYRMVTPCCPH